MVRFVDETLQREMAQYVTMHALIIHRQQRAFDAAQRESTWKQRMLARPSRDVRIGILGMGDIGAVTAERLLMFDFQVFGWSRSRKSVPGVTSFAGAEELPQFLASCDIVVCMLPLTPETENILNAKLYAGLPQGARVMNVGRGGHCKEDDLLAARDLIPVERGETVRQWEERCYLARVIGGYEMEKIRNQNQLPMKNRK